MRRRVHILAGLAAAAALLIGAPSASAAFGLDNLSVTPASTSAGANTNVTIGLDIVDPAPDLKDLTIHLPPGLVGNPLATPTCSEEQLNTAATGGAGCPAESAVGTVSNQVEISVLAFLDVPQTVNGTLYNVTPRQGEPARFGIVLEASPLSGVLGAFVLPPIVLQSPATLRQSDFGLDTVLNDLPRQATLLNLGAPVNADITITGVDLTLNGTVGNPPKPRSTDSPA